MVLLLVSALVGILDAAKLKPELTVQYAK